MAQVQGEVTETKVSNDLMNTTHIPKLTKAQYSKLLHFLNQTKEGDFNTQLAGSVYFAGMITETTHNSFAFSNTSEQSSYLDSSWVLDTGASDHICYDPKLFMNLTPITKPFIIT